MGSVEPTEAEWKILLLVRERGVARTREIVVAAEERFGWSASTTKTLLRRLVEKKQLTAERVRQGFRYRPTQSIMKNLRSAADALLARAGEDTVAPLLAYMVKKSDLAAEDVASLRALLAQREKE